jgi:DHA1 family tetracycline resistance protein-like MFS transporter
MKSPLWLCWLKRYVGSSKPQGQCNCPIHRANTIYQLAWIDKTCHTTAMTSALPETIIPAPKNNQGGFIFVFVTVALDMLAIGLIVPVLPNFINKLTDGDISQAAYYVGIFSVGWAIMQFLAMPIMGALSDQYGRKPIFLISNFGQAFAHILTAVASGFVLLAISRLLSGVFSAVTSTANAYIADTVPPNERAQKFGMLGAAFGLGFILGPAIGGFLGKIDIHLPFWVAAGMTFANRLYGLFFVKESLAPENRSPFSWAKANPVGSVGFLTENPKVFLLACIKSLADFSFVVYPATFVLYGLYRYGWESDISGLTLGLVGILAMIVQVFLVGPTIRAIGEARTMILGLLCGGIGFALYSLAPTGKWFWAAMPIAALVGFLNASVMALMSREIGPHEQGRLQGAIGAVQAGTAIIGPIAFTTLFAWSVAPERTVKMPGSAFMLASLCILIGFTIAAFNLRRLMQRADPA